MQALLQNGYNLLFDLPMKIGLFLIFQAFPMFKGTNPLANTRSLRYTVPTTSFKERFLFMTIPFVIDNQQYKMSDVLNELLRQHQGRALDIATAYFNVRGWQLLREGLNGLGNMRLLLGDEPEAGLELGLREVGAKPVKGLIRELAGDNFNAQTLRMVEDLIAFLRQPHVQVRLLPAWEPRTVRPGPAIPTSGQICQVSRSPPWAPEPTPRPLLPRRASR